MPQFNYTAKEGPDKIISGVVEAQNIDTAVSKIIKQGITPLDVSPAVYSSTKIAVKKPSPITSRFLNRVNLKELALFARQMSDLTEAAVPILQALQIISRQTRNPHFKSIMEEMTKFVENGGSLSDALAKHPKHFSTLFVNMVRTGEVSGQLDAVLNRVAVYLEKEQETRTKVRSSLAYPILILVVGILTIFVLLSFVIPRITVMFDDLNQALPLPTVLLVSISDFFAQFWWIILCGLTVLGVYFKNWVNTEKGRRIFDTLKFKIPIFGHYIQIVEVGRFARTLGTLIESGVSIIPAFYSVAPTIRNEVLKEDIQKAAEVLANGASLRSALGQSQYFSEMAVSMISVGEESGRLDRALFKIADTYEKESDEASKTALSLIGPLFLVVIVSIVGFVVVSMLLPIFQMNLLIQ